METYIIHNKKGGVGKTSFTVNIAAALAALGFFVGVVDGDAQSNASSLALPRRQFPLTLTDVVAKKKSLLEGMVQVRKRLWAVPADIHLGTALEHIRNEKDFDILSDRVDELRTSLVTPPAYEERLPWWNLQTVSIRAFQLERTSDEEFQTRPPYLDFLFFDTPPNEDELTISMLFASDKILIPAEMEEFSIQGLAQLIERVRQRFRKRMPKIEFAGIIPNKMLHQSNSQMPLDFLESVWKHFPELARRPVHFDKTISEAQGYHIVALEHNRDSRATRELCALALELTGYEGTLAGLPICELCAGAVSNAFAVEEGV